jgi:hypothetical protein
VSSLLTVRWVRRDRRVSDHSLCDLCGAAGFTSGRCRVTTCLCCGSPQCMANGGARGQCSICHVGLLPGWSGTDRPCGYKGCPNRAVCAAPRVGYCCREHRGRAGLLPRMNEYLLARGKEWVLVDDNGKEVSGAEG